jgi:hypothetical protein
MHDGVIEHEIVESKLSAQERNDLQFRYQMIDVRERHIGRGFASVHGYVSHLDMQAKGNGVEASNLCVPAGDALDFRDHAAADKVLK